MIITIDVTQDDIDKGTPGEPCTCPIALAIARALPHLGYIWVDEENAGLGQRDDLMPSVEVPLPRSAIVFIRDLDDDPPGRHPCGPFSFDLDVPDELMAGAR